MRRKEHTFDDTCLFVPGLHLELADQGNRPEVARPHRRRPVHRLPPHREHHRIGLARKRQNHQTLEKRLVIGPKENFVPGLKKLPINPKDIFGCTNLFS